MNTTPDYPGLAKMIPGLRHWPDALSETVLDAEEAQRIQSFGFAAEAGKWKIPPISPELVVINHLPEHLSIGWDSRKIDAQPISGNEQVRTLPPERNGRHPDSLPEHSLGGVDTRRQESEDENLCTPLQEPAKFEETLRKVVRVIQTAGGRARVRRVQQGSWRATKQIGAPLFREVLRELLARGIVRMDGNEVVLVAAQVVKQSQAWPPVERGHRDNPARFPPR